MVKNAYLSGLLHRFAPRSNGAATADSTAPRCHSAQTPKACSRRIQ